MLLIISAVDSLFRIVICMRSIKDRLKSLKNIKRKSFIFNSLPLVFAAIVYLLVKMAVKNPAKVESIYSQGVYPLIGSPLSLVSSLFPFSVWDIFWTLLFLTLIAGLVAVVMKKMTGLKYILRIIQSVAIMYSAFYILWGFNYFRQDISTRLGWEKNRPDEIVFRRILDTIIVSVNNSYSERGEADYSSINKSVDESFIRNSTRLKIDYRGGATRPKKMVYSSIIAKLGLSGYFGPFFNEVNLNSKILPMDYPFALAHEVAHKTGITSEAEANLVSYVICSSSDDNRLKYSAGIILLIYFLNDAYNLPDYKEIESKVDKRVLDDLYFRRKYYFGLQNKTLEKAAEAANDAYLKANHIKAGVKNYDQVVSLAIRWYENPK